MFPVTTMRWRSPSPVVAATGWCAPSVVSSTRALALAPRRSRRSTRVAAITRPAAVCPSTMCSTPSGVASPRSTGGSPTSDRARRLDVPSMSGAVSEGPSSISNGAAGMSSASNPTPSWGRSAGSGSASRSTAASSTTMSSMTGSHSISCTAATSGSTSTIRWPPPPLHTACCGEPRVISSSSCRRFARRVPGHGRASLPPTPTCSPRSRSETSCARLASRSLPLATPLRGTRSSGCWLGPTIVILRRRDRSWSPRPTCSVNSDGCPYGPRWDSRREQPATFGPSLLIRVTSSARAARSVRARVARVRVALGGHPAN